MKFNKPKIWIGLLALFFVSGGVLVTLVHLYLSQNNILSSAYEGNATPELQRWISLLYPRFETERHRLPLSFFETKWDQLVLRAQLISFAAVVLLLVSSFFKPWTNLREELLCRELPEKTVNTLRVLFFASLLITSWDWLADFQHISLWEPFFKPTGFMRFIHTSMPSGSWLTGCYIVFGLASFAAIFNLVPRFTGLISLVLFTYLEGFFLSFEKIDHTYATLLYGGIGFMLLMWSSPKRHFFWWNTTQVFIVLVYLFSGVEKLITSGWGWLSPEVFQTHLLLHPTKAGLWLSQQTFLCSFIPAFSLLFQCTFWLAVLFPRLKPYYLLAGIGFHLGTVIFLGIGIVLNPWIMAFLFFIDWGRLPIFDQEEQAPDTQHH